MSRLRKMVYKRLEAEPRTDPINRAIDICLVSLITINVVAVVLETVSSIEAQYHGLFVVIEFISVAVFSLEYLARVWVCVEDEEFAQYRFPRLRYMTTPIALIDLAAILPFYLSMLFSVDLRFLRVLRLLRILKLTRYSSAMSMLLDVLREEANSFFAAIFILMMLLILAASGAYLAEHQMQPESFGSIPHAMWWAVATLTTVGYGDVTPITPMGRIFGSLVAIVGIGMAALPAGILASGLADRLRRTREELAQKFRTALEDGVIDADEEAELEQLRRQLGLSHKVADEVLKAVQKEARAHDRDICPHCGKSLH
ncbi:ion transporter [Roseovarius sp. 2305UL8-3]|uniref:ion transporter n=1 Tax=Roseovarius conchicola TaxID=3121636 RepID=UPI003528AFAC